jgi:hypothetical protein
MKKIYSIVENLYNNPNHFVYSYSKYEDAKRDFDKLVKSYIEDYKYEDDEYELGEDYFYVYDSLDIQIAENVLDSTFIS